MGWWHDAVDGQAAEVNSVGRIRFEGPHATGDPAVFPSAPVHYRPVKGRRVQSVFCKRLSIAGRSV